ncbi:MAG: hypothetical protein HZC24_00970, partial [Rhodocyclales bacterium]|nr:hypothetical protein [Rhodocyclales bacterium]
TALGLTDWIASTEAEYVELARRKAADLAGLERQRGELRGRFLASVLGDEQSYVKVAEAEYRQLWREWCERRGAEAKADVAEPA